MTEIGILRSNTIEIIDATFNDGSIFSTACPGGLKISCTACTHAHDTGSLSAKSNSRHKTAKKPQASFIICYWHEQGDAKRIASSSGAPS